MLCQKKEINHVLGNHKSARDHLMSKFLFTMNEESFVGLLTRDRTLIWNNVDQSLHWKTSLNNEAKNGQQAVFQIILD